MIRKLENKDKTSALDFLYRDRMNNIYPISILERHGMNPDMGEFHGTYRNGMLEGILCIKKMDNTVAACFASENETALRKLGKKAFNRGVQFFLGMREYVLPATQLIRDHIVNERRYDFFEIPPRKTKLQKKHEVRKARNEDIPRLVEHYRQSEFGGYKNWTPELIENEITRTMRYETGYFYVEEEGKIISCNRIVAETNYAAILDAASTLNAYRGQRIYPSIRSYCLEYLFDQGKIGATYIKEDNTAMQKSQKRTTDRIVPQSKWVIVKLKKNKLSVSRKCQRKLKQFIGRVKG